MPKQRRALLFFLFTVAALVAALSTGRAMWFTLTYLLATLLIASFIWSWASIRWFRLSRVTRTRRTQVGQPLEERIQIENTSYLPKLWMEVDDNSEMPNHRLSRVVHALAPRKKFGWRVNTMSRQRGRYRLGPLTLRTSDPFGLFPLEKNIDATSSVIVYPQTVDLFDFTLPQGVLSGGDALRRRAFQVTTNAAGVRDYAPGDSYNRIHWRSTARRNRLIVKEFELDPLADLWIIPDMTAEWHTSQGDAFSKTNGLPPSTEEYTVTISASIARHFIKKDRAVGLLSHGQTFELINPDRGERQENRILETLAVVRAQGMLDFSGDLLGNATRFQRGTTLIVVTPTPDPKWATTARELTRRGLKVVTVLVNPASFGGDHDSEELYNQLLAYGINTYIVDQDDELVTTLSQRQ